jgi:pyridoxal phosphate enzyme (YggS family)
MAMAQLMAEGYAARLGRTLPEVRHRVARAAERAGRAAEGVRLVAVTKAHPLEAVDAAVASGLSDVGENRVEELEAKVSARPELDVTWHMVGHVQSRKARRVLEVADLIHSVDSLGLAERLSRAVTGQGASGGGGIGPVSVLVQVNTSGESSKSGLALGSALEVVHAVAELPGLRVEGLMTMAPFVDDEATLRAVFARLRRLHEHLRRVSDRIGPELSMGMTNDFEIAILEGSTMVRVGTALFGERPGGGP